MRPSVRAVIDPETLEEAVLSAVIKHLALGTLLRRKVFFKYTAKKEKNIFPHIRKFGIEQLQSQIYEEGLPNI
jgi:hypothetical protein